MVYLPPNKFNIAGRFVAISFLLFFVYCIFGNTLVAPGKYHDKNLWIMGIIFVLLIIALAVTLLGVIKFEEVPATKQIEVFTLFKKKSFPVKDIDGYYMTVYKSSRSPVIRYGRILIMKNGKELELYPGNLTYIDSVDQLMTDNSISYLGEKNMRFPFSTIFNSAI